jgi:hypothetical protein
MKETRKEARSHGGDNGGAATHEFGMVKSKGTNHGFEHIHIQHATSALDTVWPSSINNGPSGSPGA